MQTVIIVSCLMAVATAFPQDLKVVRPNHYLQQGTFGREEHLLPESFYTSGQQVEADLTSVRNNAPASSPRQSRETSSVQQQQQESPVPGAGVAAASEQISRQGSSSAESAPDSYSNIGGASGRIASALTNTNEYGETLPPVFSNLQQDSYAYYHGHKA